MIIFSKDFLKKLYKIGCIVLITFACVIIGAILWIFFKLFILFPYEYHHGLNHKGASHKYYVAMEEGNGKKAVIWANKTYEIARKKQRFAFEQDKKYIGYAYEMNGEYEKALEIYTQFVREDDKNYFESDIYFDISRIHYKLGQREKAFQEYCNYGNWCLNKYTDLKSNVWRERNKTFDRICSRIIAQRNYFNRLAAFIEYQNFLDFLEEEYLKLGSPPEYDKTMQLFRAIQNEINKKKLPLELNIREVKKKYYAAMREGNGKEALIWANEVYDHSGHFSEPFVDMQDYRTVDFLSRKYYVVSPRDFIGYASELNGEYEKALEIYTKSVIVSDPFKHNNSLLNVMRIHYKLGQREKAFREYSDYGNWCLNKYPALKSNTHEKNQILNAIRSHIIIARNNEFVRLTAFADYQDFLDFMEEEYAKLGSPPEYEEAMQLFQAIKNEIIEESLPHSETSDELDTVRNKIREDRKQNVK